MQDRAIETVSIAGVLHYLDESTGDFIKSSGGKVDGVIDGEAFSVDVGRFWLNQLARLRLASRLLRINRINVLRISKTRLLLIYRNGVFVFELREHSLRKVHTFPLTRYVHTQSISVDEACIVIGEYGNVGDRKCVGALISSDHGASWNYKPLFDKGVVKNILAIKHDPFSQNYWIFTGDSEKDSGIHIFDSQFSFLKTLGQGLDYRAISSFHLPDRVVWLTDNPFGISKVCTYDRTSARLDVGQSLPGPVWYSAQLGPDIYCCTAAEDVAGDAGENVYVLHSKDYVHWNLLSQFKKDNLDKRLFLYGLGTFPQLHPDCLHVYLNMDAVQRYDGRVIKIARPARTDRVNDEMRAHNEANA